MEKLQINGSLQELDMVPDTPLLCAVGDGRHLTCTKYGCGIGEPGLLPVTPAVANVVLPLPANQSAICPTACKVDGSQYRL